MATYLQNLITSRDNLAEKLAAGEHDYQTSYSADGRSYDWNGYRASLIKGITDLNLAIIRAQGAVVIQTIVLG